ncbi:MAG TPA: SCO6880 family protein, partial [Candidatus Eisenbacteria bacterium]|nr:SCO6880 family protein [Candidatus Eisenbacteria bacterium]
MDQKTRVTYSFGPRETRGVVLGLRAGQLVALGVGVLGAVTAIRSGPSIVSLLTGLLIASLMGLVALMPVGHLTIEQWAPAVAGYLWRGLKGQRRWTSRAHLAGHRVAAPLWQPQPRSLQGVEILGLGPIVAGGREMGYLKDRRRAAYAAVLAVRGDSFALLDRAEQDLRVGMWSSVIAGFGLRSSVIRRLQWVDRTLPEDREALDRYLEECRAPDADPEAVSSYRELIEQATSAAQRHEGFLVVQIDQRRVWKQARQMGT